MRIEEILNNFADDMLELAREHSRERDRSAYMSAREDLIEEYYKYFKEIGL